MVIWHPLCHNIIIFRNVEQSEAVIRPATLLKQGPNTGIFQFILRHFYEHLLWRTSANGHFCIIGCFLNNICRFRACPIDGSVMISQKRKTSSTSLPRKDSASKFEVTAKDANNKGISVRHVSSSINPLSASVALI